MNGILMVCLLVLGLAQGALGGVAEAPVLEQRPRSFIIALNGSVTDVTPLFGPVREAEWAPEWSPRFIHPAQGVQCEGVIFTTSPTAGIDSGCSPHTTLGTAGWSTWLLCRRSPRMRSRSALFPTANSVAT